MYVMDKTHDPTGEAAVAAFIKTLGEIGDVARKMGLPYATVHGWIRRGHIPQWRMEHINRIKWPARAVTKPKVRK